MICPKCQHEQTESETCIHCGVIFQKYREYLADSEKKISNERIQKLEEEGDTESKVSPIFDQDWKPVSTLRSIPWIKISISLKL